MSSSKFLSRVALEDARARLLAISEPLGSETIAAENATGRITAAAHFAAHDAPHYRASAMDGIAVSAADTLTASSESPLHLPAGEREDGGKVQEIDTGGVLPEWADAVVRIEEVSRHGDGSSLSFELRQPVTRGTDVRRAGEDLDEGQKILARGRRIAAWDLGGLLASGVLDVTVVRKPRLEIIATGGEVVEPTVSPGPGQVIEYNGRMLAAAAAQWGADVCHAGVVVDDRDAIAKAVTAASHRADIVAVIAGSSVGRKDLTVDVFRELGDVLVHGVDMMPGKPVSIAQINETPVVGVPGYPVSAIVAYEQLLKPAIERLAGAHASVPQTAQAKVGRKMPSRLGVEEFRRVCLCHFSDQTWVAPLARGAGAVSSVIQAHGWLRIPTSHEGVDAQAEVSVELLRPVHETLGTIIMAGAEDGRAMLTAEDQLRSEGNQVEIIDLAQPAEDRIEALVAHEAHCALLDLSNDSLRTWLEKRLPDHQTFQCPALGTQTLIVAYPEADAMLKPLLERLAILA